MTDKRKEFMTTGKKPVHFHGLINQGSTCYLNSVLQVLFMTKDFREAVKSQKQDNEQKSLDLQLKHLFDNLKEGQSHTKEITSKLGIQKEDLNMQRDAAEYYEKILGMVSPDVSKMFQGQLRHIATCSVYNHINNNEEGPFWCLPLSMENDYNYSVREGFDNFFKSSTVSGDNQMYCDQCDDKTDATFTCELVKSPEILTLLLKRFEFDYHSMSYVKIESYVDVPHTLQTKKCINSNQNCNISEQACTYKLYAVVDHVGSLTGGHYTATIQSYEDHNWYRFDDTYVRPDKSQIFRQGDRFSSQNAYLLMYRKDQQINPETINKQPVSNSPSSDMDKEEEIKVQLNQTIDKSEKVDGTEDAPMLNVKQHEQKTGDDVRQHEQKAGDDDRQHEQKAGDDDRQQEQKAGDDFRQHEQKAGDDDGSQEEQKDNNVKMQMSDEVSRKNVCGLEENDEYGQNLRDVEHGIDEHNDESGVAEIREDCDVTTLGSNDDRISDSSINTFQTRNTVQPEETTQCCIFPRKRKGELNIAEHEKKKSGRYSLVQWLRRRTQRKRNVTMSRKKGNDKGKEKDKNNYYKRREKKPDSEGEGDDMKRRPCLSI